MPSLVWYGTIQREALRRGDRRLSQPAAVSQSGGKEEEKSRTPGERIQDPECDDKVPRLECEAGVSTAFSWQLQVVLALEAKADPTMPATEPSRPSI